jgi:hypothetical protein
MPACSIILTAPKRWSLAFYKHSFGTTYTIARKGNTDPCAGCGPKASGTQTVF